MRTLPYSRLVALRQELESKVYSGRGQYEHLRPKLHELYALLEHRARYPLVMMPS